MTAVQANNEDNLIPNCSLFDKNHVKKWRNNFRSVVSFVVGFYRIENGWDWCARDVVTVLCTLSTAGGVSHARAALYRLLYCTFTFPFLSLTLTHLGHWAWLPTSHTDRSCFDERLANRFANVIELSDLLNRAKSIHLFVNVDGDSTVWWERFSRQRLAPRLWPGRSALELAPARRLLFVEKGKGTWFSYASRRGLRCSSLSEYCAQVYNNRENAYIALLIVRLLTSRLDESSTQKYQTHVVLLLNRKIKPFCSSKCASSELKILLINNFLNFNENKFTEKYFCSLNYLNMWIPRDRLLLLLYSILWTFSMIRNVYRFTDRNLWN